MDYLPYSPNTPENLILDPRGFLSVRIFFHRQPMEGLKVRFARPADAPAESPADLGDELHTDAQGKVFLPNSVPLGTYICRIENQPPAYVPAVADVTQSFPVALPVGRAAYDVVADREVLDVGEV